MKNKIEKIALIIMLFVLMSINDIFAEDKKDVLFLSSYSPGFISFNDHMEGLKASLGDEYNLITEYMSLNNMQVEEYKQYFYKVLKSKLEIYKGLEAIVIGDDGALEFALAYMDVLFQDIPMVFFGVKNEDLKKRALEYELVTGVTETESLEDNLKLIKDLHPNIDNIIFLQRDNEYGWIDEANKDLSDKFKDINFSSILTKYISLDELKNKLKNIPKNSAIITLYPNILVNEEWIGYDRIINEVKETIPKVPIYNVLSYAIGYGSIGGKVINHFNQSTTAGEIVKSVLNGVKPRSLYIEDDSANEYIFDYTYLDDYGIKVRDLPENSIILNHPKQFFKNNKVLSVSLAALLVAQITIIIALVSHILNRRKYIIKISEAKKAAEEANEVKSRFISNISHELKTPITVIMSVLQIFKCKNCEKGCTTCRGNVELINSNCHRLLRLLNNVIDVEKYNSKDIRLNTKSVNIIELIEDTTLSVVPYTEAKNLNLTFDCNCEEVIMSVDIEKIERVVLNLLSNAIKFSHANSDIEVNVEAYDDKVVFTVRDEGIGIDIEKREEVFERFVQVDNTLTRCNEGSGIGLSLVKSFVELHNGNIYVESKLNEGSKFIIELPILQDEEYDLNIEHINKDSINVNAKIELSDIYI